MMKQLLTILCALVVTMGAVAAPKLAAKKQMLMQKSPLLQQQVKNQRAAKTTTLCPWGSKLATANRQLAGHVAPQPLFPMALHRAAAPLRAEARSVTISGFAATYYPDDNTVYYGLYTDDWSQSFYFSILLPEGAHDVEPGREYTLADMKAESSEWDDEEWEAHYYTAATFTKTRGDAYDVHIAATVTDEDGGTYVLTYDEEPLTPTGETVTVDFTTAMDKPSRISDGSWFLRATNYDYSVQMGYYSDDETSPAGTFAATDFDYSSTCVYVYSGEPDEWTGDRDYDMYLVKDATATVTEADGRVSVTADLLASDGNVYHVTMFYEAPHAESYATITATNLELDDWAFEMWGELGMTASNDDYSVSLSVYPDGLGEQISGTYTIGQNNCAGYIRNETEEDVYEIYSGQFTVAYDNGNITLTGAVLCLNNVEYTLNLSYTRPTATRQMAVTFPAVEFGILGWAWQAIGENEDGTQFISIAGQIDEEVNGIYTEKQLIADYTYVVTDIVGEDGNKFDLLEANLTVSYDEDTQTARITGTMLCQSITDATDRPLFTVDVTAVVADPYEMDNEEGDFTENFAEYECDYDYVEDGVIYVEARNADGACANLEFWVEPGYEPETLPVPAGTYAINNSHVKGTVSLSEGMDFTGAVYYSFTGYADDMNRLSAAWFLVSGTVTVNEEGIITIDALNSKGKAVKCTLGDASAVGISQTLAGAGPVPACQKRIEQGRLVILKDGTRYNALGMEMK